MLAELLDYEFSEDQIAQFPLAERDASRLMVVDRDRGAVVHDTFRNLDRWVEPGDLLVLNDAKVFPARLKGRRATGGAVEILLTEKVNGAASAWLCLAGRARGMKRGEELDFGGGLRGTWGGRAQDGRALVTFSHPTDVRTAMARQGQIPLPPYIRRPPIAQDAQRYQTVYARVQGAVAAPTAGLHFTTRIFDRLRDRGVAVAFVTLTVGVGTFSPIRAPQLELHRMQAERYSIPRQTVDAIARTKSRGGKVIAVGTTTTRALEGSAGFHGRPLPGTGSTDIFIAPGYSFRVVDCMLTNFHLPRSTPLALAMALGGVELVRAAYREAVWQGYRLYSYGDAMLIK